MHGMCFSGGSAYNAGQYSTPAHCERQRVDCHSAWCLLEGTSSYELLARNYWHLWLRQWPTLYNSQGGKVFGF